MAKSCFVCGKTANMGMQVSHSHKRSKRPWKPNFQSFHTKIEGKPTKITVCAKCIKKGKLDRSSS